MSTQITDSVPNQQGLVASSLNTKISEYSEWRETLTATIDEYIDWLGYSDSLDAIQELRLYDIKEILKKDQLVMAFLAEFSRGKTETINALFFSDFNQRLLPSAPGRTTMCPTEIFWDSREEACIKLLPIETRQTDDTLTYLKTTPDIWHKIRLDITSPDAMKEALKALVQKREVDLETAKSLGFWNENDPGMRRLLAEKGTVEIPVWRHALINYPHPLLRNGLVVIDTPGLNTMGAEPELTLSIIPNAHAVLFLTATDTGITKSDMQIWSEYVQKRAAHKLVVLNKIDILWDGLESEAEVEALIQKQIQNTARELGLDARNIFAMSAQKALVAKIRKDAALLKRSGIGMLEDALANQLIESKHEILGRAVVTECSNMIRSSRKIAQMRITTIKSQLAELKEIQNQNRDASKEILANVVAERKRYEASVLTFNQGSEKIKRLSDKLLRHLSLGFLDTTLEQAKQDMGDSWTTVGLNRSIRELTRLAINLAEEIQVESGTIKKHADDLYHLFWSKHSFEKTEAIELNMNNFIQNMQALEKITNDFCTDPVNVLTEKRFLIRKFYLGLGAQIQANFEQANLDCNLWLNAVIGELKTQISSHKKSLDKRAESLMESHDSADKLIKNLESSEKDFSKLLQQSNQLDAILLKLMRCAKFDANKPNPGTLNSTKIGATDFNQTVLLHDAPYIGGKSS
ncbi:dynamin family protein [Methylotenera sp.]|uniref:dynamin family protein n=2 Tax=Methylotenera sp. TaxID=2051956 RepID=UPI00272EEB1B|nr:dynamin family protein [Methylotenera sp.]MDP1521735.1 dynamin family protein [Methylotenera sp.]MDP2071816.1 dynamin family protein [Methylotenera sp.]MDP3005482.1 dynamin family protein [Methylotenera sp.]